MEWELSKENVQPVKFGRNMDVLNDSLKAKVEGPARSSIFEHQRREYLETIEKYAGDDPLAPWIRYIKWVNDAFPAGGAQSELLKVLETCTRKFQEDERYRRDIRYLRVWIQYADCCLDPSDVLAFLEANEIGQDHALFYEAYATSMEVRRKFSKADEVYQLGIQRSAQPLGRLESMYRSFLSRMLRRGERKIREEQQRFANGLVDNDGMNGPIRAFGTVPSAGEGLEQQARRHKSRPIPVPPPFSAASRTENAKLPVLVDPEFERLPSVIIQDTSMKELMLPANPPATWCHLGNDADKKKENVQPPGKWSGAKVGQRAEGQLGRKPDLHVFVDEEFAGGRTNKPQINISKTTAPTLRLRLEDMQNTRRFEARIVRDEVTLDHVIVRHTPGSKGSFLDLPEAFPPSVTQGSVKNATGTSGSCSTQDAAARQLHVEIVFGYDTSLMSEDGSEKSFEEQRLSIWNDLRKVWHIEGLETLPIKVRGSEENEVACKSRSSTVNEHVDLVAVDSDGASCKQDLLVHCTSHQGASNHPRKSDDRAIVELLPSEPAAAINVLTESQVQPLTTISPPLPPEHPTIVHLDSSSSFTMQGDETVALKRFAEEAIVLGSDPNINSIDAVSHHGLVEPTIYTKEALADILDMFHKPLECDTQGLKARAPKDRKKRTSNPVVQSSGFDIFVDEDLDVLSPAKPLKDEKRVKSSFRRPSADRVVEMSGLKIFADEDLKVQRPLDGHKTGKMVTPANSGRPVYRSAQSSGFHIYNDENVDLQRPHNSTKKVHHANTSAIKSSAGPVKLAGFHVLEDEDVDFQAALDPNKCDNKADASAINTLSPLSEHSAFQVLVDEDLNVRSTSLDRNVKRVEASTKKSHLPLGISIDHNLGQLITNQLDGKNMEGQHQKQLTLVEDGDTANKLSLTAQSGDFEACTTINDVLLVGATLKQKEQAFERNLLEGYVADNCKSELSKRSMPLDRSDSPKLKYEDTTNSLRKKEENAELTHMVNPWDENNLQDLLRRLKSQLSCCEGFYESSKKYSGSVPISSLRSSNARNKILQLGSSTYRLKGCIGKGAFAQVFEVEDEDDDFSDDAPKLALKFQKPACPWEFYIYRQLDLRISNDERHYYGHARKCHLYSDCSFIVSDYGEKGTLQDVLNAYLAMGQKMDEVLCMFYTIEMLRMLEILHRVGIIHGDFKPDNLLIRDDSDELEAWAPDRPGCWKSQGLELIDWGRSIDMTLYPEGTEFKGDCKTDSFRCPEMIENRPWTFQADTFGLCSVVHCLLHGSYMQIEKTQTAAAQVMYRPKSPYKRYWNVELWRGLFETLLNANSWRDVPSLSLLRSSFESHLTHNLLGKKVKALLSRQTIMMFTRA